MSKQIDDFSVDFLVSRSPLRVVVLLATKTVAIFMNFMNRLKLHRGYQNYNIWYILIERLCITSILIQMAV